MKYTEKVNIGGYSFTLERDAYERLNGYLEDIRSTYRENSYASEILSDIEQRIAELFIEKGGKESIVSYALVDSVIQRIGSPSELADEEKAESSLPGGQREKSAGHKTAYPDGPKRLYRDIDHRILGGVCSGIAAYFNMDSVLVRLVFVGVTLLVGIAISDWYPQIILVSMVSLAIYFLLWIIIPAAKTVEEKCRMKGEPIDLRQFKQKFVYDDRVILHHIRKGGRHGSQYGHTPLSPLPLPPTHSVSCSRNARRLGRLIRSTSSPM